MKLLTVYKPELLMLDFLAMSAVVLFSVASFCFSSIINAMQGDFEIDVPFFAVMFLYGIGIYSLYLYRHIKRKIISRSDC